MQDTKPDASVAELLGTLARDMSTLLRQELRLASADLTLTAQRFA